MNRLEPLRNVATRQAPRRVLLAVVPPVDELDLVGSAQVFAIANRLARRPIYDVEVATTGRDLSVQGEGGLLSFVAKKRVRELEGKFDSILLICGLANRHLDEPGLSVWLRKEADRTRRIGAVCVAAFL